MSCSKWRAEVIIGYARVSTDGQTLDAQQSALAAAAATQVYAEKVSGAVTDRKAALGAGDVLLAGAINQGPPKCADAVSKAGAGFRSLADAWADTTTPHGRFMLTVLGGLPSCRHASPNPKHEQDL
jgi:hypothetical protein